MHKGDRAALYTSKVSVLGRNGEGGRVNDSPLGLGIWRKRGGDRWIWGVTRESRVGKRGVATLVRVWILMGKKKKGRRE